MEKSIKHLVYDPKFGDNKTCECGHRYIDHFNPKTKKTWGCFYEYNCGCKRFKEIKTK